MVINLLFVKIGYTKDLTAAKKATKYIAFRSREGEKGAFDRDNNYADVKEFNKSLKDGLTSHPSSPKVYKVILSVSGDEYKKMGLNYKEYVRETMSNYEACFGRKLTWIAAEHMNCTHPHIHLLVKPVYQDRHGVSNKLNFNGYEFTQFKNFLTHSYETTIGHNKQFQRFIEKEKLDIVRRRLSRNVTRVLVRGNSTIFALYGIYSLVRLSVNKERLQKYKSFVKQIRKFTYGSHKYQDFRNLLFKDDVRYGAAYLEVPYKDRKFITDTLNSKGIKWQAIENKKSTTIRLNPFDDQGTILNPEKIKEISNSLNSKWKGR